MALTETDGELSKGEFSLFPFDIRDARMRRGVYLKWLSSAIEAPHLKTAVSDRTPLWEV